MDATSYTQTLVCVVLRRGASQQERSHCNGHSGAAKYSTRHVDALWDALQLLLSL